MNRPLVVCRRASDPLTRGSVTGFQCTVCKEELAVTPTGIAFLKRANGIALCNSCGLEAMKKIPPDQLNFGLSETALSQLIEWAGGRNGDTTH